MDESFSTHYQIHHLNSVVDSSNMKGGVSQKYRGVSHKHTLINKAMMLNYLDEKISISIY
jgi:hypothetical protein